MVCGWVGFGLGWTYTVLQFCLCFLGVVSLGIGLHCTVGLAAPFRVLFCDWFDFLSSGALVLDHWMLILDVRRYFLWFVFWVIVVF